MWQLHWLISLIPDAVLNLIYWAIIVAGITGVAASWIARWVPFYGQYARVLKPLGVLLIILGVYLKGGYDTEMMWRGKLEEANARAAKAEEDAKKVNTEIVTVYKDRVKVVKQNTIVYQDKIKEVEKIINKDCKVAPEVIDIHNDAAKNRKTETNK